MAINAKQPKSMIPFISVIDLMFVSFFFTLIFIVQIFSPIFAKFKIQNGKNLNRKIDEEKTTTTKAYKHLTSKLYAPKMCCLKRSAYFVLGVLSA